MTRAFTAGALLFLTCAMSCASPDPAIALTKASRSTHDVLAPRVRTYVASDQTLPPEEAASLTSLLTDWELAISRAETFYGLAPITPQPARPPVRAQP